MRNIYYLIALAFLTLGLIIFSTTADAGGPWNDQYCDVEVTKIRVVTSKVRSQRTSQKRRWCATTEPVISCLTWASLTVVRCTPGTCL